ncbi:MAG: tRNA (adenosine(37)-N6)-dimethylallyltransferase MiaA [Terriglobales bacterium]
MMSPQNANALVVAGPTASGKTALALALAERLRPQTECEIVNFDSVQLYRDFDLGTAKPVPEELALVPHHLIGVADARVPWTGGEYARRARPLVEDILRRGRLPILAGGTGFYLRALLQGLSPAPLTNAALRQRLQRKSPDELHRLLLRLDPEAHARIALRDTSRAIRALEVRLLSGQAIGAVWRASPPQPWSGLRPLRVGLAPDRIALYGRIDARAARMFAGAIQEETRRLLQRYPPDVRIWNSHGYKQACDIVLRGAAAATALAEAQQEQRHYAKRQWTWFRADAQIRWLAGFGDNPEIQAEAAKLARAAIAPGAGPA